MTPRLALNLLLLGYRIWKRLQSKSDRNILIRRFASALSDGHFSITEWTTLGRDLGVFDKNEG